MHSSNEISEDAIHFQKVYENVIMSPAFQNVQIDVLFQNFDQRIDIAKKITMTICDLERQVENNYSKLKSQNKSEAVEIYERENKKIWKQAVKCNLAQAVKNSRTL